MFWSNVMKMLHIHSFALETLCNVVTLVAHIHSLTADGLASIALGSCAFLFMWKMCKKQQTEIGHFVTVYIARHSLDIHERKPDQCSFHVQCNIRMQ